MVDVRVFVEVVAVLADVVQLGVERGVVLAPARPPVSLTEMSIRVIRITETSFNYYFNNSFMQITSTNHTLFLMSKRVRLLPLVLVMLKTFLSMSYPGEFELNQKI